MLSFLSSPVAFLARISFFTWHSNPHLTLSSSVLFSASKSPKGKIPKFRLLSFEGEFVRTGNLFIDDSTLFSSLFRLLLLLDLFPLKSETSGVESSTWSVSAELKLFLKNLKDVCEPSRLRNESKAYNIFITFLDFH